MDIQLKVVMDDGTIKERPYTGQPAQLRAAVAKTAAAPGVVEITAVDQDGAVLARRVVPEGKQLLRVTMNVRKEGKRSKRRFCGTLRQIVKETRRVADEESADVTAVHPVRGELCRYPRERKATRQSADGSLRTGRTYVRLSQAALAMMDGEPGSRSDYIISAIYQKYSREHGRPALRKILREHASSSQRKAVVTIKATGQTINVTLSLWSSKSRGGIPVWVDKNGNYYLTNDKKIIITPVK